MRRFLPMKDSVVAALAGACRAVLATLEGEIVMTLPAEDVESLLARVGQILAAAAVTVDTVRRARGVAKVVVAHDTIDAHVQLVREVHREHPRRSSGRLQESRGTGPHWQQQQCSGESEGEDQRRPVAGAHELIA